MNKDSVCKNCAFAIYKNGYTQIGCHMDMINKFKNAGANIIEAYDEDKEFYVIKNRLCHFFRPESWGKSKTIEERIRGVTFETKIPINAVIFVDNDYNALKRSLVGIYKQTFLPAHITVIRSVNSTIWPNEITNLLSSRNIKWRLENIRQQMSDWRAFHLVQKFCLYPYHIIMHAGYVLDKNFCNIINDQIINKLLSFSMIYDENSNKENIGNGLVIPTSVYQYFYFHGDPNLNFVENIKEYECQHGQIMSMNHQKFYQKF